ncbi:MAG: sigma-70 family RNA polymerase sigma factor [Gemmatimonadaceae bacterium]|nr:sigma-70 family RNA polymerase sigma factor [Gloeobacterales cyanobacterium ES-bin-141]
MLMDWSNGDKQALDKLTPLIYSELHSIASRYTRNEHPSNPLQATALVNEAYLRMIDQTRVHWRDRAHFFGVAAQMMRRILVDHARSRDAAKRGGGEYQFSLDEVCLPFKGRSEDLLAVDDALDSLARIDPRQSRMVELRFFGGLTIEQTAEVLDISPATVKRDWNMAKAWLYRELSGGRGEA